MHTSKPIHSKFEAMARRAGCVITGATNEIEIHHVKGRTYKHNKVLIGPLFILPLHKDYHRVTAKNDNAYHKNKHGFIAEFGRPSDLFVRWVLVALKNETQENKELMKSLISDSVIESIGSCPL